MPVVPDTSPAPGEAAADEVIAGLRAANARLRELLAERDARIGQMEVLIADLQAQIADLAAREDSKNSSKPPSSDGLGKPEPKSLRKKTGRKPVRQKGQPGATMELTDHPDLVVRMSRIAGVRSVWCRARPAPRRRGWSGGR